MVHCQHRAEPRAAEMASRYGAETTVPESAERGGDRLLRGEQDEKRTSIRMRECSRMRDEGRA
jgi:hypothetical protein